MEILCPICNQKIRIKYETFDEEEIVGQKIAMSKIKRFDWCDIFGN